MEPLEIAGLIAVVLFAVLVGVLLPTLLQARVALASARRFFDHAERELDGSLSDLRGAAAQLRSLATAAEPLVARASELLESAEKARRTIDSVSAALTTTSRVAPAAFLAARAFMASFAKHAAAEPQPNDPAPTEAEVAVPRPVSAINN